MQPWTRTTNTIHTKTLYASFHSSVKGKEILIYKLYDANKISRFCAIEFDADLTQANVDILSEIAVHSRDRVGVTITPRLCRELAIPLKDEIKKAMTQSLSGNLSSR